MWKERELQGHEGKVGSSGPSLEDVIQCAVTGKMRSRGLPNARSRK